MIELIWGAVALGVLGVFWFAIGLTKDRRKEEREQHGEFTGVIDVRRNNKERLRTDGKYRKRVRDFFNDESG